MGVDTLTPAQQAELKWQAIEHMERKIANGAPMQLNLRLAELDLAAFYAQNHARKIIDYIRSGK